MSEPEIDRRCLSCGASVRQVAAFCPQCGQSLEKREPDSAAVTQVQSTDQVATVDESHLDEQSNSERATTIWAPALPEEDQPKTIDESEDEQQSDSESAPTIWAPALPEEDQPKTIDETEDEQQSDSESAPTIWAPALPKQDQPPTIDESQDGQHPKSETAPTIWAPALPEPAIVHQEEVSAEPSAATVAETRPLIRDEARHVLKTQPLITNTTLSNQTVADIPSPVVRLPGDAPPRAHEHQLRERVEKIRKASSVMIDQAAYDPSFRFLLVAAVLFILFLVLMILSKVLG